MRISPITSIGKMLHEMDMSGLRALMARSCKRLGIFFFVYTGAIQQLIVIRGSLRDMGM